MSNYKYEFPTQAQTKSGDSRIDGILSATKWGDATLTYSFPTSKVTYTQTGYDKPDGVYDEATNFTPFSASQKTAAMFALDKDMGGAASAGFAVEGFTNMKVNYVSTASTNTPETFRFGNTVMDTSSVAHAYYPGRSGKAGDVWMHGEITEDPVAGNPAWSIVLHELGHALGLSHAQEATDGFPAMPEQYNSFEMTVMGNRAYPGSNGAIPETLGRIQTFMRSDIAALQHLYGANYTVNSGDTVYKWTPGNGNTYVNGRVAIAPEANRIFATLWDGGGTDTYDLSAYTTNLRLDLRAGEGSTFSDVQSVDLGNGRKASANIYNAFLHEGNTASLIENAKGGSGSDTITGNQANNRLEGGAGNDVLSGLNGNDYIFGGAGNDKLYGGAGDDQLRDDGGSDRFDGGAGTDTVSYYGHTAGVTLNLGTGYNNGGDTYVSIENVIGSSTKADNITGSSADNRLQGLGGNDTLIGGGGNDTLLGGAGTDRLDGGTGSDTASYADSASGVTASLKTGINNAGDTYVSIENLEGSNSGDSLTGGDSTHALSGLGGNDKLQAGAGLSRLTGGAGTDAFILTGNSNAIITDFAPANETIKYLTGFTTFADISNAMSKVNADNGSTANDVMIRNTNGTSTTLYNVDISALSAKNFGVTETSDNKVEGTSGNDVINSSYTDAQGDKVSDKADIVFGRAGNDRIYGYGGDDQLNGDAGNDVLMGGTGNDVIKGGIGNDWIGGQRNNDKIYGEDGEDTVVSGSGDDYIDGGNGNDNLYGDTGRDTLIGGLGDDMLSAGKGNDMLKGQNNNDRLYGHDGNDMLYGGAGNDMLNGQDHDDHLYGEDGNDQLYGEWGNDTLEGGNGNDSLSGHIGNDVLTGGAGADIFVFLNCFHTDTVTDFNIRQAGEKIDLRAVSMITDYNDLTTNHLSQSGGNAVITAAEDTITLLNVSVSSLTADHFIL